MEEQEVRLCQSVLKDVSRLLKERQMAECAAAVREQRLAAKAGGEAAMLPDGEVRMRVHPAFYHYWGHRLGYDCWRDRGFVSEFLRDNPECRVKSVAPRVSVVMPDKPRFHKTYGAT